MIATERAVEVLRNAGTDKDPDWSVGSGYLIGGRLVLTAAHNVGAGECLVRMVNGSEHPAVVRRQGGEIRLDLAVLELTGNDAPDVGEGVRYAVVSQEQAERLEWCTGLGFPRFKEDPTRPRSRSGKALRNIEQLDGEIPTAAGALASLLTFRVTARPREHPLPSGVEEFGGSPWQGISGTVVFARDQRLGERVVGVVTEHHLAEGGSALTLVPIGAIGVPGVLQAEEQRAWWDLLGVPDPAALPELPGPASRRRPQPPAPPRGAVAREELAAATLAALRDGPAPLVALAGGPGFGKSVLARMVAAAADTPAGSGAVDSGERWCPGGVVWLDVGQDPDLSGLLAERLTDLTGQRAGGRSVEQLASDLGAELAARRCLLVFDDVWPSRTGRDDVVGLVLSRIEDVPRLVTTRSATLLDTEPGARRIDVGELQLSEAAALLATALPAQPSESDTTQLGAFARRLGQWPLLLGLAAAHLRRWVCDGVPLDQAVRDLANRYAAKGITAFDARYADLLKPSDPAQRARAVGAAVEASLGLLTPEDHARYRELAVFPPGQPIPGDIIADLWAPVGLDRFDTGDLLGMLADLSLLSVDLRTDEVRVHDLLRDYLTQAGHQQQAMLHGRLLGSWGDPLHLMDEYRIRWYVYHLDRAGESNRLYALITPAWRDHVLAVTGALSDVASDTVRAAQHAARQHNFSEELRCRLIVTTLANRAQAVPRALLVALARVSELDRAIGYANLLPSDERDSSLEAIATALAHTEPDHALAVADRITGIKAKEQALAGIAAAAAGADLNQALRIADRITGIKAKEQALAGIAAAAAGADLNQALRIADRITGTEAKEQALAGIAAAAAGADPKRALDIADRIDIPALKVRALIVAVLAGADPNRAQHIVDRMDSFAAILVRRRIILLVGDEPSQALAAARVLRPDDLRVRAVGEIARRFSAADISQALDSGDHRFSAEELGSIATAVAATDPGRAVDMADRVDDRRDMAQVLSNIAVALASADRDRANRLIGRAMALVERIDAGPDAQFAKAWAWATSAATVADADLTRALDIADRIEIPQFKARALAGIAAALVALDPDHASRLTDHALMVARSIQEHRDKARALADIAAALAPADPGRALKIAYRIYDPYYKARARAGIAAALAPANPDRALKVANQISPQKEADLWSVQWNQYKHMYKAQALAHIAVAVASSDPHRASRLINDIVATASGNFLPLETATAHMLADIAITLADTFPDHASRLAEQALNATDTEGYYPLTPNYEEVARALASIAAALASIDPDRARRLAKQALADISKIHDSYDRAQALSNITYALSRLARTLNSADHERTAVGFTRELISCVRRVDTAISNALLWHFAQLAVSSAAIAIRADLVQALVAADEW